MNSGALSGVAGEPGCRTAHRAAARLALSGVHPSPKSIKTEINIQ